MGWRWCTTYRPHTAAAGSLSVVTAAGARSRHEIAGPSEVQEQVSRWHLASVRAGVGRTRRRDAVALCRRRGRLATIAVRSTRRADEVLRRIPLTLRLVFRLPLRQAEGFLRSVLSLMGVDLEAPDHTTLSRRSQSLAVDFRRIPSRGPVHLVVDSTGLSVVGAGEWAAVKHGGRGHRGWKKLHLAVDRAGVIVAHALTEPRVDDATTGIDLIETVDDEVAARPSEQAAFCTKSPDVV